MRNGWAIQSGQYQRNTGGLPKWYLDRPAAARGDEFYIRAFAELSTTRNYGFTLGPIPWDRIVAYGSHKGLEPDMIDALVAVIREMDRAWLEWQRDDSKSGSAKQRRRGK